MIKLFSRKNAVFVGSSVASAMIGLLITILIARLYSKNVNANYQYFLTFFQLATLIGWARADQFLISIKHPPSLNVIVKYFIKNQFSNWLLVFILSIFFIEISKYKFIENYSTLIVILLSGYLFGLTNITNQILIIKGHYQYQGVYDLLHKSLFLILLYVLSKFNIYLGTLFLFSMFLRLLIFYMKDNIEENSSENYNLSIMVSNGRRMFWANVFSNISSFLIVYLITKAYSKSFYADYALVLILISFPASILGQYIGLMIHRRYVNGNKDFKVLSRILILTSICLIFVYLLLPQFKNIIIQIIGDKWSSIWAIYDIFWPLSIFSFNASILERTGYEFGNKKWPMMISVIKMLGIFFLVVINHFEFLLNFKIGMLYFYLIVLILYITYILDLIRNLFILYKESKL